MVSFTIRVNHIVGAIPDGAQEDGQSFQDGLAYTPFEDILLLVWFCLVGGEVHP